VGGETNAELKGGVDEKRRNGGRHGGGWWMECVVVRGRRF
jgi:hypothetical protein